MYNRELKAFHNENRTHVTKKEYSGVEITAENAVNAPMDLKIYGASEQTADYVMCEGGSAQVVTDEPVSPSPDYPSEITPLVAAGTYKIGTKDARYLIELPDMYEAGGACDKLMFDKISKTARLKQEIDPALLDPTKTIEENTQAVLAEPVYTELAVTKTSWTSWAAPYAEVPWKIYGKNLFSTERYVYSGQLKYTNISNNSFKFEGSNASPSENPGVMFSLNLPAGTYKLTFKKTFKNSVSSAYRPNEIMIRKNSYNGNIISSWQMGGDCENKLDGCVLTLNEDCTKLFLNFYASILVTAFTDYLMQIEDIQLEKGSKLTDFEAYNATPPESLTPSVDYPHKIYTSREMTLKCTSGDTVNSTKIPLMGNAMEVSDIAQSNLVLDGKYYLSDYIEYNSATDKAYRHKFIDDTLFNTTLPIKDQTQAILAEPTVEEITAVDGEYSFKDAKSVQDGFTLTTESYSTDGLLNPKPMYIEAKIKVIKEVL